MHGDTQSDVVSVAEKLRDAVLQFFRSLNRDIEEINDDTDLIRHTGATSDDGLDFAIDLEDILGVGIPKDFNPFVHPNGKRGMKFRELVAHAEQFIAAGTGGQHGG